MKRISLGLGTAAMALGLWATSPALAANPLVDGLTLRTLSRIATQYVLLAARMAVDLTYENLTVDPYTGDTIITGLKLYPSLDWDQNGECEVSIERISSSDDIGFDGVRSRMELTGVTTSPSCFEPQAAGMMSAFGYDGLTAETVSIDTSFQFGSSAADVTIHAAVKDAAIVNVTAAFDYVWISGILPDASNPSGEPFPVAKLGEAEIAIENRGLFERIEPMLAGQLGDLSAAPIMVQAALMEAISDGVNSPGARETAFAENAAEEVARFIAEKNRIVVTVAPSDGVWLNKNLFESPALAIQALNPVVSQAPLASRALISASALSAAINGDASALDTAARLRVGEALLTGLGAPRSVAHGQALLQPMAEQWDPHAAALLAEAMASNGEPAQAYGFALRAASGGHSRAMTLADSLEEKLGANAVLSAQAEATATWPGAAARGEADQALIDAADIGAMRERAHAASLGRGVPRSYADAYYWASLAAAAGDRSSADLRERIDARFAGSEGEDRDAWQGVSLASASNAIATWTEGGLGARIAALYGVSK